MLTEESGGRHPEPLLWTAGWPAQDTVNQTLTINTELKILLIPRALILPVLGCLRRYRSLWKGAIGSFKLEQ